MIHLRSRGSYYTNNTAPNPAQVGGLNVRAGDLVVAWMGHCQDPLPDETAAFSDGANNWHNGEYVKRADINGMMGWAVAGEDDDDYAVSLTLSTAHDNMRFVVWIFAGAWDESSLEDSGFLYEPELDVPMVASTGDVTVSGVALVVCGLTGANEHVAYGTPEVFGDPAQWSTGRISPEYGGISWAGTVDAGTGDGAVSIDGESPVDSLAHVLAFKQADWALSTYTAEATFSDYIEHSDMEDYVVIGNEEFIVGGFEGSADYLQRAYLRFDASSITLVHGEQIIGGAIVLSVSDVYGTPVISAHESAFQSPLEVSEWTTVGDLAGESLPVTATGEVVIPIYRDALSVGGDLQFVLAGPNDGDGIVAGGYDATNSEDRVKLLIYTAVEPYLGDVYAVSKEVNVGPGEVTGDPITGLPPDAELRLWALDLHGNQDPVYVDFSTLAAISPGSATHGHIAGNVALAQDHLIPPSSSAHAHIATAAAVTQHHLLVVLGAIHGQAVGQVTITQAHLISPLSTDHVQVADAVGVVVDTPIVAGSSSHTQTAGSPVLLLEVAIPPDSALHAQAATGADFEQGHVIAPDATAHAQSATSAVLVVGATISPAAALHLQLAGAVSILQAHVIVPASGAHAQSAAEAIISQTHSVAPDAAAHAQVALPALLIVGATIEADGAQHAQATDTVDLQQGHIFAPASSAHTHTVDAASITQGHTIGPDGSLHGQSADEALLSLTRMVAAGNAIHLQIADAAALGVGAIVHPGASTHAQQAGTVPLFQAHSLTVLDAVHATDASVAVVRIMEYADFVPGVQRALYVRARPVVWFMRPNRWGVMVSDILEMRPGENDLFDIHCGPVMRSGAVIDGVEEITIAGPDEDLEMVGLPSFDGQIIQVRLRHTDPAIAEIREYRISAKFSYDSDDGATSARQVDGWVRVKPLIN